MAAGMAVWGIEIGQCGLKAVKLRPAEDGRVELAAFDLIEHPKILSQPDADADELIRAALEKFASRNDWQGDQFVVGVPGQQTFSRFCKLPPVDAKKIPDIVRFEASQQIPFDMDDVVWDYQVFQAEDMPDVEVGIFAMRKDLIRKHIDYLGNIGIAPIGIQTIPSALYNFCRFDGQGGGGAGATVIIDVGAQNTDLVIVEPDSAWMRNIPLGGNSFTEALVKAFKLSFAKAESLKRTAATSKYARQIFQAMRPVFAELVAEVQRSIGFYSSTHREVELQEVLACGNAFRLPGLQKYLENNLTISGGVTRLEKFKALVPSATINAPQLSENILSFAPAYGLALQGLGLAPLAANLLPPELARIALWKKKRPFFVLAAACLGLAAVCPWARTAMDRGALAANADDGRQARQIIENVRCVNRRFEQVQRDTTQEERILETLLDLQKHKRLIPGVLALVHDALPTLVSAAADDGNSQQCSQMLLDSLDIKYVSGAEQSTEIRGPLPDGARGPWPDHRPVSQQHAQVREQGPGFHVYLIGRLVGVEGRAAAATLLMDEYIPRLGRLGSRAGLGFHVPADTPGLQECPSIALVDLRPYVRQSDSEARNAPFDDKQRRLQPPLPVPPESVRQEDADLGWRFEIGFSLKLGEAADSED